MACSCKNKNRQTTQVSSDNSITYDNFTKMDNNASAIVIEATPIEAQTIQPKNTIFRHFLLDNTTNQHYDFSANTKPLQTCTNCAEKHISLAVALVKTGGELNNRIAVGQLMAASYHYNQALPQLAVIAQHQAQYILINTIPDIQALQNLLKEANKASTNINATKSIPKKVEYSPVDAMKHICLAYTLLFTQIFYQNINRSYAVGELVLAALYLQEKDRATARHLREIWKVVQQIVQPNDQDYKNSKAMLQKLILDFDINGYVLGFSDI